MVWADIQGGSGSEGDAFEAVRTAQNYALTIRFRSDVAPGWRVEWAGRQRRITAVSDPDGAQAFLELSCEDEL